jgi:hypothetical protein
MILRLPTIKHDLIDTEANVPEEMSLEEANLEHLGRATESLREAMLKMTPEGPVILLAFLYNTTTDKMYLSIPEGVPRPLLVGLLDEVAQSLYHNSLENKQQITTTDDRTPLWRPDVDSI